MKQDQHTTGTSEYQSSISFLVFAMTSLKSHNPHCPYFPNPWDDPEDQIDFLFWLEAIDNNDFALIAYYLRRSCLPHKPVLSALADKLDPQNEKASRYVWRRARGRPLLGTRSSSGSILSAPENGNLTFVADQLRNPQNLHPLIRSWLADQLDPASPRDSRLVNRQARGRPPRHARSRAKFRGADTHIMFLGAKIERKRKQFGKLEAALHHFMTKSAEVPKPVSRSRARRAYEFYHKRMATIRKQPV
jgi:hypothetical protein